MKPPHIDQCGRSVDMRGLFLYPASGEKREAKPRMPERSIRLW
nr:MAG TPA: hypothetical protein [Caudoviricetes sp.]